MKLYQKNLIRQKTISSLLFVLLFIAIVAGCSKNSDSVFDENSDDQSNGDSGNKIPNFSYTRFYNMDFVKVKAGCFQMGDDNGDNDGKPVHKVCITKDFYLGKTEVTQAQWKEIMGSNPRNFKGDKRPVDGMSWDELNKADGFLAKLNTKSGGNNYRLPTEAEWEYATRAGTTTKYSFGDDVTDLGKYAWFKDNSSDKTHSVAQKLPNPWGLYDMHGNVREWIRDYYDREYYKNSPSHDPYQDTDGLTVFGKAVRGGSYLSLGEINMASAFRENRASYYKTDKTLGFRLLREPQQP